MLRKAQCRRNHADRNDQGLGNRIISPRERPLNAPGPVQKQERLGGMLNYYNRAAA